MGRSGAELAHLFHTMFRILAQTATERLARLGFEDFRAVHDAAMRAIEGGADNASALGRRLSVSKQAAAQTIAVLEQRGYVEPVADARDGRRKHLRLTPRGMEVLRAGERIFDDLRHEWADRIGIEALESMEQLLRDRIGAPSE